MVDEDAMKADASESLEDIEELFLWYCIHNEECSVPCILPCL